MPALVLPRPDLFDQGQAAEILTLSSPRGKRFHRHTIGDVAPALGLQWKSDPTRPRALVLDRSDMDRIADVLNITIDWDALLSA
jgi:hypothetical protein